MSSMQWETPAFTEIDMSAEIGGYQGEPGPDPRPDYFVAPDAPAPADEDR